MCYKILLTIFLKWKRGCLTVVAHHHVGYDIENNSIVDSCLEYYSSSSVPLS